MVVTVNRIWTIDWVPSSETQSNLGFLAVSKVADHGLDLVQWDQCLLLTASPWYNTTTMGFALSDMKYEGNQIGVMNVIGERFNLYEAQLLSLELSRKY